ncbi:MAG: hypothetical protein ABI164_09440 [Acidobacteriaceae bacterium]
MRPSIPGFSKDEALQLLGMCTAANFLGPVAFAPFPVDLLATDDANNPLPNDNGQTYPYPHTPIWPSGWTPGVPSEDSGKPWQNSIVTSRLRTGVGVNSAIIAYNSERDAYAVAFAGTLNSGAAMEDIAGILVPAGPVDMDYLRSAETYVRPMPDCPIAPAGGQIADAIPEPPPQPPLVHLGYREAVESLTVGTIMPANLRSILRDLPSKKIDLYVTGHSLGASVAQLFSAWITAGGVPSKEITVKCYSFATPKSCNAAMASNYDLALSNKGFSYCVSNSLDTAPQLPPTHEVSSDLFNPAISADVLSKADPTGLYATSPLAPIVKMILHSGAIPGSSGQAAPPAESIPFPFSIPVLFLKALMQGSHTTANRPSSMAFTQMGAPYILSALQPVVYNGRCYPPEFFPRRGEDDLVEIPDVTTRQWWQHWPYNYAKYLADHDSVE